VRVRVHLGADFVAHAAVGLVVALALFVLHHAALALEHLLRDVVAEEAHAVRFQEQRALERRHRDVFEEVGAVGVGGAVAVVRAEVVHRLAEAVRVVLGTVEEEVLEQVGEAGLAALLVARTDVVPHVHAHHRHAVVFVHDQGQAVGQHEFLVGDRVGLAVEFDGGGGRRRRGGSAGGRSEGQRQRGDDRLVSWSLGGVVVVVGGILTVEWRRCL
jgi:hypothetical protein